MCLLTACCLLLFFGVCSANYHYADITKSRSYVLGGSFASEGQFPWAVFLTIRSSNGDSTCTGTIINSDTLLTAAHCVASKPSEIKIDAGIIDGSYPGSHLQTRTTNQYRPHTSFVMTQGSLSPYDMALLKIQYPFKFNRYVQPLNLGCNTVPAGTTVRIVGFGLTEDGSGGKLKSVDVPSLAGCPGKGFSLGTADAYKSMHHGDSGGPLVAKTSSGGYRIVGINIGTDGLDKVGETKHNCFTSVAQHCSLIQSMM